MSFEEARQIITECTSIAKDDITVDLAAGDLPGWDSLGHMRIILALETRIGRELTTDEIISIRTVRELSEFLSPGNRA